MLNKDGHPKTLVVLNLTDDCFEYYDQLDKRKVILNRLPKEDND